MTETLFPDNRISPHAPGQDIEGLRAVARTLQNDTVRAEMLHALNELESWRKLGGLLFVHADAVVALREEIVDALFELEAT